MITYKGRRCGVIGRRTGLKIPGSKERTGSTPVTGTTSKQGRKVMWRHKHRHIDRRPCFSFSVANPLRWALRRDRFEFGLPRSTKEKHPFEGCFSLVLNKGTRTRGHLAACRGHDATRGGLPRRAGRVPPPAPEKGHPKGCPFSDGPPLAGYDPLRSILARGAYPPLSRSPHAGLKLGSDLDGPLLLLALDRDSNGSGSEWGAGGALFTLLSALDVCDRMIVHIHG